MASKIPFILGLGAGYVLGTRAGRAQYEKIKAAASRVADQPFVRDTMDTATTKASTFARSKGEVVTDKIVDAVKDRLFGTSSRQAHTQQAVEVDEAEVRSV